MQRSNELKQINKMTLVEIKNSVDNGIRVFWTNSMYEVIKDRHNKYLISCNIDKSFIGLTWNDNITLNGKESDFYTI